MKQINRLYKRPDAKIQESVKLQIFHSRCNEIVELMALLFRGNSQHGLKCGILMVLLCLYCSES